VQLTYWPLVTAGRFDVARTLVDYTYAMLPQLNANAQGWTDAAAISVAAPYDGSESGVSAGASGGGIVGDLVWLCHNLWLHATYTNNGTMLADLVYPLLHRAVNLYTHHMMFRDAAGKWHLPKTESPEYPYPPPGPSNDTNYDLALLLWGVRTLTALAQQFSIPDPDLPLWADVAANLTAFPTDDNGLRVAADVPFSVPHRHFSHLFAIYPLRLVNWDPRDGGTPATQSLIQRSLDHWNGITCPGPTQLCPNGFTYDGSASISASMVTPDRAAAAAGNLSLFMVSGLVHASTMYSEGGNPCFESPPAAANALQELVRDVERRHRANHGGLPPPPRVATATAHPTPPPPPRCCNRGTAAFASSRPCQAIGRTRGSLAS